MLGLLLILINCGINNSVNQGMYGYVLLGVFVVLLAPIIKGRKLSIRFLYHLPVYLNVISGLLYAFSAGKLSHQFVSSFIL